MSDHDMLKIVGEFNRKFDTWFIGWGVTELLLEAENLPDAEARKYIWESLLEWKIEEDKSGWGHREDAYFQGYDVDMTGECYSDADPGL